MASEGSPKDPAPVDLLSTINLMDIVCDIFSHCSHTEQVTLLEERLPLYLKRDFVSILPPEIVIKILSYLETGDIFRCLLVSRNWNRVITDCEPFWKYHTRTIGVSPLVMATEIHKYDSYKDFALAVMRARGAIRRGKPTYQFYSDKTGKPPNATLTCRPAKPITNGVFIAHEVYSGSDFGTYYLSVRIQNEVQDLVELTAVRVSHLFVIIWCFSSLKHMVIHGSNGTWIQTEVISWETHKLYNNTWYDRVYSGAYHELTCCPECSLVGIIAKVPREQKIWDILLNRLVVGYDEPEKVYGSFSFLPLDPKESSVFFQIHKIAMIPDLSDTEKDVDNFCRRHKLLIQFGACICVFSLDVEYKAGKESLIIENICNLCPFNDHSFYTTPSILGHQFSLSSDHKLAAYFVDGSFFAWNVETMEMYGCRKKGFQFPTNADCIAVGYLFSIMYTSGIRGLRVISTVNGESLLFHRIDYTGDNPVHAPIDQTWLNNLDVPGMSIPLAVTLREWQNPGFLSFKSANAHEK